MKSAKEMFEELGYEETMNNEKTLSYSKKFFISDTHRIEFFKNTKEFICHWYSDSPFEDAHPFEVNMEELQAINKQVEELHWNDTIVNIDVKLDGKKVMEAMRGGNNA